MLGTAITQVVAVYRGNDHILQAQVGNGHRKVLRLIDVQWFRTAVADIAKRAATGTDVTHDHERGGTAGEALAQVRAGSLFADAVQLVLAQQLLDTVDFRRNRNAHANPVGLFRQLFGRDDLDRDARDLFGSAQLHAGFHLRTGLARTGRRLSHIESRDHGLYGIFHRFMRSCHIQSIPPVRVVCSA
ncbi:hypothetical protein D3C84_641150 [compost metagenome]